MEYEDIIQAIEDAPLTQSGAIMIKAIEEVCKKGFFADRDALLRVVGRVTERMEADDD